MSRWPVCSGADAVKAFRQLGYELDHQTGSHIIGRHPSQRRLTVSNHRELAKGTWRALICEAGLTMAVHGNFGTGRARCSVRAVVVNPHAWMGNGGGQRTDRLDGRRFLSRQRGWSQVFPALGDGDQAAEPARTIRPMPVAILPVKQG